MPFGRGFDAWCGGRGPVSPGPIDARGSLVCCASGLCTGPPLIMPSFGDSPLGEGPSLDTDRAATMFLAASLVCRVGLDGFSCFPWGAGASLGYRILAVSKTYAMLSSAGSRGAVLGSPASTTICLPKAVMLWPERGEGEGPMFWKVYHRLRDILKAARSPRSSPCSVLPPKIYITSLTSAAEWPSLGAGM